MKERADWFDRMFSIGSSLSESGIETNLVVERC